MRDMRYKVLFVFVAGVLALLPVKAQAQDDKKVHVTLGGGFTVPNSDVKDHFGNGYNFNFGVDVNVTPVLSIEGLYSFNGLGEKQLTIPVYPTPVASGGVPTDLFANMNMQYGTVNLVFAAPQGSVRPYGLVGMGVYYRPVEITTPGVGFVPGYCDPWYYICYPGGWVETTNIIGKRSSTDFGMDFGGGVRFGYIYAELRYHYIWGPTVEEKTSVNPLATTVAADRKANGQFLVTTFGVRF
jgi:opacity protein-like surface antigen